jgi:hypothetical protein
MIHKLLIGTTMTAPQTPTMASKPIQASTLFIFRPERLTCYCERSAAPITAFRQELILALGLQAIVASLVQD